MSVCVCICVCAYDREPIDSRRQETPCAARGARCCSVLQCVAVCCSMLQYVAVPCSALQCFVVFGNYFAVCCSVLRAR